MAFISLGYFKSYHVENPACSLAVQFQIFSQRKYVLIHRLVLIYEVALKEKLFSDSDAHLFKIKMMVSIVLKDA